MGGTASCCLDAANVSVGVRAGRGACTSEGGHLHGGFGII